jgi:hypothetical protein
MSVFRAGKNKGLIYHNTTQPAQISANFVVDSANGNGLGIRNLKSNGWIRNVFMHTSATPGVGNGNLTNPNPAVGFIMVQFKQNFNIYLGGFSGFISPLTGSALTSTTNHSAYVITSLGTTTLAQWNAAGLPAGFTPAVGASFIATATGSIGGTGTVKVPTPSGNSAIEVVGDPNQLISNSSIAANGGAIILLQCLASTSSSTTTLIPSAPADNSVAGLTFCFDQSSADPMMLNGDPGAA